MKLNKDNIKLLHTRKKVVEFKEYDLEINLIALNLKQQLEVEEISKDDTENFIFHMLKFSCVDEHDHFIFEDDESLKRFPADLAMKVFKECLKLNHLLEKDVEKLAKN